MSNARPMPQVSTVSRPYWEGCNRGVLMLQRCTSATCGKFVFYPRVCCPHCGHGTLEWVEANARGRIESYTLVHRPQHATFRDEVPILFVAVRLDEGPLMYSRLMKRPDPEVALIGHPVRVVFGDGTPEQKLALVELAP